MESLINKLKLELIEQLNLEDLQPSDIKEDEPLFGGELELDSIDALEIIVLLEREYGLKIKNQEDGKEIFQTVRSIAEYIHSNS